MGQDKSKPEQAKAKNNTESQDDQKPVKPKKFLSAKTKTDPETDGTEPDDKAETTTPDTTKPQDGASPDTSDVTIITKKQDEGKNLKKVDLKSVAIPPFQVEAPIHITKRIGGFPQHLSVDQNHVFLDDGQNLRVYSDALADIGTAPRTYPILKVTAVSNVGQELLYVSETNNVLEIFEIITDAQTQKKTVKQLDSFDVGGPFSWLDSKTLLVFLESKMQFLDFSNLNNITVLREIPIGGVTDKLILKNQLYLSRSEFLDVVNLDTGSLTASLRIGQNYQFLGATRENETNLLHLALLGPNNQALAVQVLKLNADATGITDLGLAQILPQPLTDLKTNLSQGLLFGKTIAPSPNAGESQATLRIFDLKAKRFLRGPLERDTSITGADIYEDWLYLIQSNQVAQYHLQIQRDVINQYQAPTATDATKPALAQIGAEQTLKDEYSLLAGKGLSFDRSAKNVFLLDQNHIVILQEKTSGSQELLVSDDLANETFSTREIAGLPATPFKTALTTPFGLVFATTTGEIYFLDVNLRTLQKWPIQLQELQSWVVAEQNDGYLLVAVSKNPIPGKPARSSSKTPKVQPFVLEFYKLTNPTQIELVRQMPLASPGFIASMGYDMFALITQTELDFYTARDLNEPRQLDEQTKPYTLPATLIAAKLSPQKDLIYALLQDGAQRKIRVFDYEQPQNFVDLMPVGNLSVSQFEGASFSRGGQLFILPTQNGSYFYDLSNVHNQPEKDLLKAHWPMPAESVDVAGRGQFVCTALGSQGVYCGDLLFY